MKFSELVNLEDLKKLCENFTAMTGMVAAILDLEGNVLIATGWQDICTCFHRVHPITAKRCRESDTILAGKLAESDQANVYRCKNGLVDVAIPIKIHGHHVANLFTGQFFFEPPDKNFFIRQAQEFGFDQETYLAALDSVPIYSEDKVNSAMLFLCQIGQILGEMGLAKNELKIANSEIEQESKRLRESEQRFRLLLNTIPDLIWLKDEDGVFLSCNHGTERLLGANESEIVGKTDYDFVDKELADHFRKYDRKVMATRKTNNNEEWVTFREDGRKVLLNTTKTPMLAPDGTLIGVLGVGRDITTRSNDLQALVREKETAQRYLDIAGVMLGALNRQGEIILMNKKGHQILGYPEGKLIGKNWFDVCLPGTILAEIKEVFRKQMSGDFQPLEFYENTILNSSGEELIIAFHNTLLHYEDGISGVLFSGEDITERKQLEASIHNSRNQLDSIFRAAPTGIGVVVNRNFAFVNNRLIEMVGYTAEEMIGSNARMLYASDEEFDRIGKEKYAQIKENGTGTVETVFRKKNGDLIDILLSSTPLDLHDLSQGVTFTALDITERKSAERQLLKHRDHLEELVEERTEGLAAKTEQLKKSEKSLLNLLEDVNESRANLEKINADYVAINNELKEFAYIVSHDLKAPLRAISQLTHWISEDYSASFDAEGKMQMDLILQRVKRMDNLIDGILRYSRLGRTREKTEPLDLNILVQEVIENLAPPSTVKVTIDNKLPVVRRDSVRLGQVFQNLISNAIKFMDKSHGIVRIGSVDEESYWKFKVSDNGPGIEKKYHDKVFQIFQTLAPRDEHENTGIGLALVKKIISIYGGSVWVESEAGQGSTFFFTLPKKEITDEQC
jgi:PAS domain S-box-containing protein